MVGVAVESAARRAAGSAVRLVAGSDVRLVAASGKKLVVAANARPESVALSRETEGAEGRTRPGPNQDRRLKDNRLQGNVNSLNRVVSLRYAVLPTRNRCPIRVARERTLREARDSVQVKPTVSACNLVSPSLARALHHA
jgi:hypothetical protein